MTDAEHKAVFTWPSTAPTNVVLTGSFDNWSSSVTMTKTDSGFEATVALPWDTEVVYKHVVDGQWLVNDQQPKKDDGNGQLNNVYCSPKAPELPAVADAPTATSEVQPEAAAAPVAVSETAKPIPEVNAEDQLDKAVETAPAVVPPLVDIVPLATEVQHTTDPVPEAAVGPTAATLTTEAEDVKPAASLPIVEVLPSQDALPETAPVEGATTANESAAAEATPTPAIDGKNVADSKEAVEAAPAPATGTETAPESTSPAKAALAPAPGAEVAPTAVTESAPTPAPVVEATSEKADEAAPATPAVVSDAVTVPVSDSTAAKVDAVAAPTESGKPAKSVAASVTEDQPVATPSTSEAKLRSNGSVNGKADRRSRTLSVIKGKLFPTVEGEEMNVTPTEDDTTQAAATPTPTKPETSEPPREKRKSIFGRMASIFKPSS